MEKEINDIRAVHPMVCELHLCLSELSNSGYVGCMFVHIKVVQLMVCGGSISVACDSILPCVTQNLLILSPHLEV